MNRFFKIINTPLSFPSGFLLNFLLNRRNPVKIKNFFFLVIFCSLFFIIPISVYSISSVVKATKHRIRLLSELRQLNIVIDNFGDAKLSSAEKNLIFGKHYPEYDSNFNHEREYNAYIQDEQERQSFDFKKNYKQCRDLFDQASISLFSRSFIVAELQFREVKWRTIQLFKALAFLYIKRAEMILKAAASKAVAKITEYGPENDKMRLFYIAFDPKKNILLYNPKEYYFVFAKTKLKNYLEAGFKILQRAKNKYGYSYRYYYQDVNGNKLIERKSKSDTLHFKEIIKNYEEFLDRDWMMLINDSRRAKLYAFEIFKILHKYRFNNILNKYNVTPADVNSLFDDRIPDQYQVDFLDSQRKMHKAEMKIFRKHLQANWVDTKKYIRKKNGRFVKVSGENDTFAIPAEKEDASLEKSKKK